MSTSKEKYIKFCDQEADRMRIYHQHWWLDAVCGSDGWEVAVIENAEGVIAALPYHIYKKGYLTMPEFTQTIGPWIKYPDGQKYSKRLSYEKKMINELMDQVPGYKMFSQRIHYQFTNWLPFFWRGFAQTTRYTYVIEDISDTDKVIAGFDHSKRKNIKKARKVVKIHEGLQPEEFYKNHKYTLKKEGKDIAYSYQRFLKVYEAVKEKNAGGIYYAVDEKGNMHAALFIIWDQVSAYDLISTIDTDYRSSGAASLLVAYALEKVKDKVNVFDFEGSMIEGVENSFRQFGTVQYPYMQITDDRRNIVEKLFHKIKGGI